MIQVGLNHNVSLLSMKANSRCIRWTHLWLWCLLLFSENRLLLLSDSLQYWARLQIHLDSFIFISVQTISTKNIAKQIGIDKSIFNSVHLKPTGSESAWTSLSTLCLSFEMAKQKGDYTHLAICMRIADK